MLPGRPELRHHTESRLRLPPKLRMVRGLPEVPDEVLVEIVEEIFLPLVRGRAPRS